MRDMYQTAGVQEGIDMDHIKHHYYTSHPALNVFSIVPRGPNVVEELLRPHQRHLL
jgi:putative glutathione S-transferase